MIEPSCTAQVCSCPLLIASKTRLPPSTNLASEGHSWPYSLLPSQATVPSVRSPHTCLPPLLMAVKAPSIKGDGGPYLGALILGVGWSVGVGVGRTVGVGVGWSVEVGVGWTVRVGVGWTMGVGRRPDSKSGRGLDYGRGRRPVSKSGRGLRDWHRRGLPTLTGRQQDNQSHSRQYSQRDPARRTKRRHYSYGVTVVAEEKMALRPVSTS